MLGDDVVVGHNRRSAGVPGDDGGFRGKYIDREIQQWVCVAFRFFLRGRDVSPVSFGLVRAAKEANATQTLPLVDRLREYREVSIFEVLRILPEGGI